MSMDNLGQTGTPVTLPDDVKSEIENARNSITIMSAEYTRLQKLAYQEKTNVENLHTEKTNLTDSIATLKSELETTVSETAKGKIILEGINSSIDASNKILKDLKDTIESTRGEYVKKSADLDKRETLVKESEDDLNTKTIEFIQKETEHNAKVEKLKKAIE